MSLDLFLSCLLLFLTIVVLITSWYKQKIFLFYFMCLYLILVPAQVLYIALFLQDVREIGLHSVDPNYFSLAVGFVLIKICFILIFTLFSSKNRKIDFSRRRKYVGKKLNSMMALAFTIIFSIALVRFLGIESVLNDSRPGTKHGTVVFIVFCMVPLYVSLTNYFHKTWNFFDAISILTLVIVLSLISKMHALAICLSFLVIISYQSTAKQLFWRSVIGMCFLFSAFVYLQSARHSGNEDLLSIAILLTILYEYGNETFLGLYSALSNHYNLEVTGFKNLGIFVLFDGIVKTIPFVIRPEVFDNISILEAGSVPRQSIVSGFDEEFFRAFGLAGAIIAGIGTYWFVEECDTRLRSARFSPLLFAMLLVTPFLIRGPSAVFVSHLIFLISVLGFWRFLRWTYKREQ